MRLGLLGRLPSVRLLSGVAAVVSGLLTVFVYLYLTPFTLLAAGASAGFIVYALLGETHQTDSRTGLSDSPDFLGRLPYLSRGSLPTLLTAAFLIATSVSVLSLTTAYYSKPLLYFVAISLAAMALLLRIFFTDAHRTNVVLAFLFGLNTFSSNQLAFPLGLNGPDIGVHVGLAQTIAETGRIEQGTLYSGFPAQHILASTVAILGDVPVRSTYQAVGVFGMVLGILVVYLIGRKIAGRRLAVLAMVVYASMDYVVYRAGHPSKLAYALPLILLTLVCVVYLYREYDLATFYLFVLFSTGIIFTHHHSAFVGLVMIVVFSAGYTFSSGYERFHEGGIAVLKPRFKSRVSMAVSAFGGLLALNFLMFSSFSGFASKKILPKIRDTGETIKSVLTPISPGTNSSVDSSTTASEVQNTTDHTRTVGGTQNGTNGGSQNDTIGGTQNKSTAGVNQDAPGNGSVQPSSNSGTKTETEGGGDHVVNDNVEEAGELVKDLVRLEQIPDEVLFLNTLGSSVLVMLGVLGVLYTLKKRSNIWVGFLAWLGISSLWVVAGVVLNVPFLLPQRVYVISQITALVFFASQGVIYLTRNGINTPKSTTRRKTVLVVLLLTGFVFFSTASTIAGIETSPFNEDVPHRAWYTMVEGDAAENFLEDAGVTDMGWARGLPVTQEGRIEYEKTNYEVIGLNYHRLGSGVVYEPGHGHMGTAKYVFPENPESGLGNKTKIYDNGGVTLYKNKG